MCSTRRVAAAAFVSASVRAPRAAVAEASAVASFATASAYCCRAWFSLVRAASISLAAAARLSQTEQTVTDLLSQTEDADMAKTMVAFSMQQSVYQSALKSGAAVIQPSLLDFLR